MADPIKEAASLRDVANADKKAADAALYAAQIARQRERYAAAYSRCSDGARQEAARGICVAAAVFENDAKRMPTRAKRAVELLKHAVFMLDPKAPA
ncbi:hypothetical protein [Paraburkholderia caballeronis]|uniref:Uncharacterized protein n=1 Tax=Paraburkholderia caballeronis TaxID=416943 RepID=A0A1H7TLA5_9BURK|nr:hypothetical protein [Paraburkholderia caballeronis]PXW18433.1 hypothetical protein C7403_116120 [Paraburkholderia caballeronis]PXW95713.1 hypothetical protein C7407_116120 [Paraburkholderia caballeronis]RAJ92059.1 hypothetical protein C7409_116120 [Paraburkholderia caballeronis]SEB76135.1 hypothetical protein SAMN05445871_1018 [Paraburkholderia caballeronis]SEL85204.1 hypothetical protein SAMN05192542_115120 [Paraburkholderia caballeronis]